MVSGPPQIPIVAGIAVGIVSSLIQSLGLTIQRKSHVLNEDLPEESRRPDYRRPLWLFGFGIFISSNVLGSVFQIASLPVVILAPLGAISLLWNAVFARLLLGDVFSASMGIGTLLVAGGAVLIGIFGVLPTPTHSIQSLIDLFGRTPFLVYFSLVLSSTLILLVITHAVEWGFYKRLYSGTATPATPPMVDPASPTQRTPLLQGQRSASVRTDRPASPRLFLALSYAVLSGTLSGFGLLFAKAGVELLVLTASGDNQFWRWQAWVLVPALAFFGLSQLWYLTKSLTFADPTLICPLAFCVFNISSILDSLVYFDQFRLLSPLQLSMILLGTLLLLAGVWLLSLQSARGVQMGTGVAGAWMEGDEEMVTESPGELDSAVSDVEAVGLGGTADDMPLSPTSRFRSLLLPARNSQGSHPLPAFSIGLSPVSPGFSLSPPPHRRTWGRRSVVLERDAEGDASEVHALVADEDTQVVEAEKRAPWWKPWSAWSRKQA